MIVRRLAVVLVLAVACGALPASAIVSVGPHDGVFTALAVVGKAGECRNYGGFNIVGGGLGFIPTPPKNAIYGIVQSTVLDTPNGVGTMWLCGRLTAPLQGTLPLKELGIGASCLAHKGWDGKGTLQFPSKAMWKWLSNLGWKNSAGDTVVVTADVGGVKGKKIDLYVGAWQFRHNPLDCLRKDTGDKATPGTFTIAGSYVIIPGLGGTVPKKAPKK